MPALSNLRCIYPILEIPYRTGLAKASTSCSSGGQHLGPACTANYTHAGCSTPSGLFPATVLPIHHHVRGPFRRRLPNESILSRPWILGLFHGRLSNIVTSSRRPNHQEIILNNQRRNWKDSVARSRHCGGRNPEPETFIGPCRGWTAGRGRGLRFRDRDAVAKSVSKSLHAGQGNTSHMNTNRRLAQLIGDIILVPINFETS